MPLEPTETCAGCVLLVTGMSGAGKTSALKAFEDMGFEALDNIPLSLLESLVAPLPRPMAIGVDIRTRDFSIDHFLRGVEHLSADGRVSVQVVFIDCDDDELRRRYAETRHRHPLAKDRPVTDGIAQERKLIMPLRDRADLVVDTTRFGPGELKRILQGHFGEDKEQGLSVFVTSFGFKHGLPRDADLVFDVRFLRNPHYDPALKPLSGQDGPVADFVAGDSGWNPFFDGLTGLLLPLLPRYAAEGKSYLTIAVGCTGGRHRSVFTAERLAEWLRESGQPVRLAHRDLDADAK